MQHEKHEITDKQLAFLENYIAKKYPYISLNSKIELIDHLVSDFEINGNGNISNYLADELGFIRTFINNRRNESKITYGKKTWRKFFSFFTNLKLIPYTILLTITIYILIETLNNKYAWVSFFIMVNIVLLFSMVKGVIHSKKLRNLDEVKYLGAEIWLPFVMLNLADFLEYKNYLQEHKVLFMAYWLFAIIYGISAYLVLRKEKQHILKKYSYLLKG